MATQELAVQKREGRGKNDMNRLRTQGIVPAVLYGHKEEAVALSIAETALKKVFQQEGNVILSLTIDGAGKPKPAILKDVQRHPVTGKVIHVDLYQISLTEKITVRVPLHLEGVAPGIRDGGILEHHLREVEVRCLPTAMPSFLTADISSLKVGMSLHVSDLPLTKDVEILTPKTEVVALISAPSEVAETAAATTDAAAAAPAGPEVIGEKEREERRAATDKAKDEKKKEKEETKG